MKLSHGTLVAVADGAKLHLFQATGTDTVKLEPLPEAHLDKISGGSGGHHHSNSANPADAQIEEDDFSASVVALLNHNVAAGNVKSLVVVAAPKALGEMRKHYSKQVSASLAGELAKDLTGQPLAAIERALQDAA